MYFLQNEKTILPSKRKDRNALPMLRTAIYFKRLRIFGIEQPLSNSWRLIQVFVRATGK